MGKVISMSIAVLLQLSMVLAGHIYFTNNPKEVAIVVESSYGLTTYRNNIVETIESLEESSRYTSFHYGTDKTYQGKDVSLDSLFRVNFGKVDASKLDILYPSNKYSLRYLLSFTDVKLNGWDIINVNK